MKKIWKIRKDKEGVSPVIATILMVAITVVLAAVLYVMVLGFRTGPELNPGLTFSQEDRTTTSISLMIVTAPDNAKVASTQASITQDGVPTPVNNVTVYSPSGIQVAWFDSGSWNYASGYDADSLDFRAGMTVLIAGSQISVGDKIKLTSAEDYYGISIHNVS